MKIVYRYKTNSYQVSLSKIFSEIDDLLTNYDIPEVSISKIKITIEEVLTNIVKNCKNCNCIFKLSINNNNSCITFTIIDSGEYFNPTEYLRNINREKVKLSTGEKGLLILSKIYKKMHYKRFDKFNVLFLKDFK